MSKPKPDEILDRRGDIVLAYRPYAYQMWVTWKVDKWTGGYYWGHYFSDLDRAKADFASR